MTVSYGGGTEGGAANVLQASRQLDVCVRGVVEPWQIGIGWEELDLGHPAELMAAREAAEDNIARLEAGLAADAGALDFVEMTSERMLAAVELSVAAVLERGAFPVVVGGEHAISLGAFRACAKTGDFGLLQIDAHMDLRVAYEGFRYSHASVMHNALSELEQLRVLTQVGIRDYCPEEEARLETEAGRLVTFFDADLQAGRIEGDTWQVQVEQIIATLPQRVWVSFDIDGLEPALCAHTGTPVAGGLSFAQADYLLRALVASGKEIIGCDFVEVAGEEFEYEGAVAARLAYAFAVRVMAGRD